MKLHLARITGSLDPWVLTINSVASRLGSGSVNQYGDRSGSVDQIGSEARSGNRTHELDPYAQIEFDSQRERAGDMKNGGLVRSSSWVWIQILFGFS
ncbi:hypothetical protein FCV25MIE_00266 [Fagus crenata]